VIAPFETASGHIMLRIGNLRHRQKTRSEAEFRNHVPMIAD
jgi:hypothetical protein